MCLLFYIWYLLPIISISIISVSISILILVFLLILYIFCVAAHVGEINFIIWVIYWYKTGSSAVAQRPCDASCHLLLSHSRSFEMTLVSRACVSPY